ncbi:hypothetical protein [Streptomyces niveus]|uniref:hypothetical protein n=1 Tax=Streptomyces niveus TaxID=193462 RepID=UPI0033DDF686
MSLYLLAAAAMLVGGLLGAYEWYAALACWLIGSLAIPVRHGVSAGWDMAREGWRLRTSGVLVCLLSLAMVIALTAIGLAGPLAALHVLSYGPLY